MFTTLQKVYTLTCRKHHNYSLINLTEYFSAFLSIGRHRWRSYNFTFVAMVRKFLFFALNFHIVFAKTVLISGVVFNIENEPTRKAIVTLSNGTQLSEIWEKGELVSSKTLSNTSE